MLRRFIADTLAAVCALTLVGCTPGPMNAPGKGVSSNKPIPLGSDPSSGSVEAARRQLTGTWDLVSLESVPPAGGARVPVKASGMLVYDEYGNLTIDAHTTDPAAPVAAREATLLTFKGRAVIDVPNSELKLMALTGNVDPNEVLAPERRRKYVFEGELLKLSAIDAAGNVTSIATWKRRP
jgi:hypothetical protein